MNELEYPSREENLVRYLSVRYSMPEELVNRWLEDYGEETAEKILADFLKEKPVTIRCRTYLNSVDKICDSLKNQGVTVEPAPYLPYGKAAFQDTIISWRLMHLFRGKSLYRM